MFRVATSNPGDGRNESVAVVGLGSRNLCRTFALFTLSILLRSFTHISFFPFFILVLCFMSACIRFQLSFPSARREFVRRKRGVARTNMNASQNKVKVFLRRGEAGVHFPHRNDLCESLYSHFHFVTEEVANRKYSINKPVTPAHRKMPRVCNGVCYFDACPDCCDRGR